MKETPLRHHWAAYTARDGVTAPYHHMEAQTAREPAITGRMDLIGPLEIT